MWSATRWQTYKLMEAQIGTEAMRKSGINNPTDLIKFPWDKKPALPLTDKEREDLQAEMEAINAAAKQKDESL